jgi:hypothetical protein
MHLEELLPVEEVVATLEAGRQRLSDTDLVGASRSALLSTRDALSRGWPRRRRASRWPWVAGVILGTTVLGLVLMAPAFRRRITAARASGRLTGVMRRPTPTPVMSPADETDILAYPAEPHAAGVPPLDGATAAPQPF